VSGRRFNVMGVFPLARKGAGFLRFPLGIASFRRSWPGITALLCMAILGGCKFDIAAAGKSESSALAKAQPVAALASGAAPSRMALAGGQIIVAGPRGFCIDRAASNARAEEQAIVVLSSCKALGGGLLAPSPGIPAILTATLAPASVQLDIVQAAEQMQRLFATEQGRAALSRSGRAGSVQVIESFLAEDAFYLRVSDTSPFPGGEVSAEYWRAIIALQGRVLTISAHGLADSPLARNDGIRMLRDFITSIREVSGKN